MLVDHEAQLASFAGWVADAGDARGSIVLVEGEAGCGKTSVVRVGTQALESWWGWCDPLSTPRPLGPLRDLAPAVGVDIVADPFTTYDELLRVLRDREAPVAVVLEDVHWADDATLGMPGRRGSGSSRVVGRKPPGWPRSSAARMLHRSTGPRPSAWSGGCGYAAVTLVRSSPCWRCSDSRASSSSTAGPVCAGWPSSTG